MGAGVAEDPAAAVHVQDHGQRAVDAGGPDDPDAHSSAGVNSYRNGGRLVARANSSAAGSSTTGDLTDMVTPCSGLWSWSGGRADAGGLEDQVGGLGGVRDGDGVRGAGDLDRSPRVGAVGQRAQERR